ncbi:hypothetical protein PILCRDRAFT_14926 [Piloderma croceum F 1598]|uniref:Uncharacterized protein n=1 Tax=Piloderma croceum (strain F 1598) TaxID=765440 RepID=A0A0C3B948_PILCF|nr:hypothetical protein PILCRDRAFT_14926 [Piloderma croceum F 1598]
MQNDHLNDYSHENDNPPPPLNSRYPSVPMNSSREARERWMDTILGACSPLPAHRNEHLPITLRPQYNPAPPPTFLPYNVSPHDIVPRGVSVPRLHPDYGTAVHLNHFQPIRERGDPADKLPPFPVNANVDSDMSRPSSPGSDLSSEDGQPEDTGCRKRHGYSAEDIIALADVTANIDPYSAPWKEKKVEALLAYHENKSSPAVTKVRNELGQSGAVSAAAMIELIAWNKEHASQQSQAQLETSVKKKRENEEGGRAIREASMQMLHRRHRHSLPSDSDIENQDPSLSQPRRKRTRQGPQAVVAEKMTRLESLLENLINNQTEFQHQQIQHQREMVESIKHSNDAYVASQQMLAGILQDKL